MAQTEMAKVGGGQVIRGLAGQGREGKFYLKCSEELNSFKPIYVFLINDLRSFSLLFEE